MTRGKPETQERIHRAVSADGTALAGRVYGQGPPLLLVHGSSADGDLEWANLVPHLRDQYTCYLMSTRGRGLSGDASDFSPERITEDICAFAESIGEPVAIFGVSSGGMHALGAAGSTDAVYAVAAHEPIVLEVVGEEAQEGLAMLLEHVAELVAAGRLADAARAFLEGFFNEEELAVFDATEGYFEAGGRYIGVDLQEIGAGAESSYSPTDPAQLARISAPVLVLRGGESAIKDWAAVGARFVVDNVENGEERVLEGAGHMAPALQPERVAEELTNFFTAAATAG